MLVNALLTLINFLIKSIGFLISSILFLLPNSPFTEVSLSPIFKWLGYLNYLVPVAEIFAIMSAWGVCIGLYYVYQIALRWGKVVN